jgi:ABC-type polysaccharide/polyol phosphate transport system ATPase subunit
MADSESGEVLVDVEGVSKRFCRDLRSSLVHGVRDIAGELLGTGVPDRRQLRPGEFWALDDVSFQLRRGECLGLIGPNGAGKSTLLKLISGLIKPDAGRIRVRGRVGALIELGAGFHPLLTGRENIRVNASILGLDRRQLADRQDAIIDFADIGDAIDAPVQSYSSGMRARLGFAIAAHLDPDVLLIDEVLAVGDLAFRIKCTNHMLQMTRQGTAVIFVTHSLYQLNVITNAALLLKNGAVALLDDPAVVADAYEAEFGFAAVSAGCPHATHAFEFRDAQVINGERSADGIYFLNTEQPFDLAISYRLPDNLEPGVQVGVLIKTVEGLNVCGFTTNSSVGHLSGKAGLYSIVLHFEEDHLLQGNYLVGLSAFTADYAQQLAAWDRALRFRVRTHGYNGLELLGHFRVKHTTEVFQLTGGSHGVSS